MTERFFAILFYNNGNNTHAQASRDYRIGLLLKDRSDPIPISRKSCRYMVKPITDPIIGATLQALAAAKALVKHFHHSARATEELRKKQESMNQPTHKLVNECKTRWNSTFYMCQSLLQNRWPVSAVIADESVTRVEHRRLDLSNAQWELLGDLVKILHPLEIGTTHLCSESTSSISSILPVLFGILKHLEVKEGD